MKRNSGMLSRAVQFCIFLFILIIAGVAMIFALHNSYRHEKITAQPLPIPENYEKAFGTGETEWRAEMYQYYLAPFTDIIEQLNIEKTKPVVQEYIVLTPATFRGTWFDNIKVFDDNTGQITTCYYHEALTPTMYINSTLALDAEKTRLLVSVFEENGFWKIPSSATGELMQDGSSTYIEGIKGNRYHVVGIYNHDYDIVYGPILQQLLLALNGYINEWEVFPLEAFEN